MSIFHLNQGMKIIASRNEEEIPGQHLIQFILIQIANTISFRAYEKLHELPICG